MDGRVDRGDGDLSPADARPPVDAVAATDNFAIPAVVATAMAVAVAPASVVAPPTSDDDDVDAEALPSRLSSTSPSISSVVASRSRLSMPRRTREYGGGDDDDETDLSVVLASSSAGSATGHDEGDDTFDDRSSLDDSPTSAASPVESESRTRDD